MLIFSYVILVAVRRQGLANTSIHFIAENFSDGQKDFNQKELIIILEKIFILVLYVYFNLNNQAAYYIFNKRKNKF